MNESNPTPPTEDNAETAPAAADKGNDDASDAATSATSGTEMGSTSSVKPDTAPGAEPGTASAEPDTTPSAEPGTASDGISEPLPTFTPIAKLGKAVSVLVIIQISFSGAILLLFFGSVAFEVLELENLSELTTICIEALEFLQRILYIVGGIVFIVFLRRALRNLAALNATGASNQDWQAVWSWFIPIANLFIPFFVVREVWKGSNPAILDSTAWKQSRGSKRVGAWWIVYLVWVFSNAACNLISGALTRENPAPVLSLVIVPLFIERELVFIAAGILFILVIRSIRTRQENKLAELAKRGDAPHLAL